MAGRALQSVIPQRSLAAIFPQRGPQAGMRQQFANGPAQISDVARSRQGSNGCTSGSDSSSITKRIPQSIRYAANVEGGNRSAARQRFEKRVGQIILQRGKNKNVRSAVSQR